MSAREQEFNLRDYWQILVRRRWLIAVCLIVTTVATGVSSFLATPVYRAQTTLAIERSSVRLLNQSLQSSEPSWLDYQNWYNTQYQIMASDAVIRRAVDELKLLETGMPGEGDEAEKNALLEKIGELRSKVMKTLRGPAEPGVPGEVDPYRPYTKAIAGGMSVEPVRDSHLVRIGFVHPDPVFAADAADALADAYWGFTLSERMDLAKRSEKFFVDQLAELGLEIEADERELRRFADANNITTGDSTDAVISDFNELRQKRTALEVEVSQLRSRWESLRNERPEAMDAVRQNTAIKALVQTVNDLQQQYDSQLASFGPELPRVKQFKADLDAARTNLQQERERVAREERESARAAYEQALAEKRGLDRLYEEQADRVDAMKLALIEYDARRTRIDRNRDTLEQLLTRQNDMRLAGQLNDTAHNVRVVEAAQVPQHIYKPNKKLNLALGFLFGLVLGVGLSFLMEYVDNTIKSPEDARQVLGERTSMLGMIPSQDASGKEPDFDPGLVSAKTPLSPISEAYRELRTAVLLATPGHPPRDIAVTSCQPGEGKTTTAINLATTLAQLGRRVLLVDTDLRRPRCHQVLRAASSRGVSTYLSGMSGIEDLVQPTSIERVALIAAGPIPPNPAELLDSQRFVEMIEELRAHDEFDHVIFDSPPVLSVVDPLLIGRHTEGTVLVMRSAYTTREAGRLGLEKIESGRVKHLLGVVLNAVQLDNVPYQYRYYRHGYRQDEPSTKGGADREGRRRRRPAAAAASGSREA